MIFGGIFNFREVTVEVNFEIGFLAYIEDVEGLDE